MTNQLLLAKENRLSHIAIGCAIKIHKALGPGLLESAYQECLYYELKQSGLDVEKEKPLPLVYEAVKLEVGYRVDLLVENKLIIELKAVDSLNSVHMAQVLTYLRLSGCKLGLLVNFNVPVLKQGIKRVIHTKKTFALFVKIFVCFVFKNLFKGECKCPKIE